MELEHKYGGGARWRLRKNNKWRAWTSIISYIKFIFKRKSNTKKDKKDIKIVWGDNSTQSYLSIC